MNIGVFISNENRRKKIIEELNVLFDSNDIFKAKVEAVDVPLSEVANVKTPVKLEQLITKRHLTKPGNLLIIEWNNLEDDVLVTSDRSIFISNKVGKLTTLLQFSILFLTYVHILHSFPQFLKNSTKS